MQDRITPDAAGGLRSNPIEKSLSKALKHWFQENPSFLFKRWMIERYFEGDGFYDILELYHNSKSSGDSLDLSNEETMKFFVDDIIKSWGKVN